MFKSMKLHHCREHRIDYSSVDCQGAQGAPEQPENGFTAGNVQQSVNSFLSQQNDESFSFQTRLRRLVRWLLMALVPTRVLNTEKWDPTNCVFQK